MIFEFNHFKEKKKVKQMEIDQAQSLTHERKEDLRALSKNLRNEQ